MMQRLCGRPGCSESASAAYGMRPEDLVFWLDVLPDDLESAAGVLCLRHADSMVVPRGWTLNDLRDPDLRLFRPPTPTPVARARPHRPERTESQPAAEQLELATGAVNVDQADAVDEAPRASATDAPDAPGPWSPAFDEADDLDGLLAAQSPLLSRAFRTVDRPDR